MGKWAGIVAKFDIGIHYRTSRVYSNADALSRSPVEPGSNVSQVSSTVTKGQGEESSIAKAMFDEIVSLQLGDLLLVAFVQYLTYRILSEEPKLAKRFALERHRYTLINNVLYFIDPNLPNRLRLAVPQSCKQKLLEESHAGRWSFFCKRTVLFVVTVLLVG